MAAERPVAIVTGSSRDIGEFVTYGLAQAGFDILGIYRNPQHDKEQLFIANRIRGNTNWDSEQIKGKKGSMVILRADLLNAETPGLVVAKLDETFDGQVDALVLNASGGYRNSLEDARKINVDGQLRLVDALMNKMKPGSVVVYNTSDPAHRFRELAEFGGLGKYDTVAQSKNEVEAILRERIPEFDESGIRLAVVVGNKIVGTFVGGMLDKMEPDLAEYWQGFTEEGVFPTTLDMATAVAKVVRHRYPTGHTEYVGIRPEHQLYPANIVTNRPSGKF